MMRFDSGHFAIILGASSGFGLATAQKLAAHGMNLVLVHRDRRGSMDRITLCFDQIRQTGVKVFAFNADALSDEGRTRVLDEVKNAMGKSGRIRTMLHSIAFGNLKPLAPAGPGGQERGETGTILRREDFDHTIHAMSTSLADWTRDTFERGMFADDARVLGLTSQGSTLAWRGYAAVSAAKAALEALVRAIAFEYAPYGIRANIIQAGICPTPALAAIPGHKEMLHGAALKNPLGRLTRPEDVANTVFLLSTDEAAWINGAFLHADGGEHIAG